MRSHCNYTQLQGEKRNKEQIVCEKEGVLASLNSSLRNLVLLYNCTCVLVFEPRVIHLSAQPLFHFQVPFKSPLLVKHICCQSAVPRNPIGISCHLETRPLSDHLIIGQVVHCHDPKRSQVDLYLSYHPVWFP